VFSFEENVITPGAPTVNLCQTTHWGDARTSDADVQVREVVQQALPKLGRIREAMYVNLWDVHLAWRMEWVAGTCFMVRRYFGFEDSLRVLVCLPRVHRNRLAESHGVPQLSRKYVPLHVSQRVVVVIIEADLAPPNVTRVRHGVETA